MPAAKEELKALVTNVQGFSTEDGPGIRTTVFFKGCPLRCPWCHNPEGLVAAEELIFYADRCISCGSCAEACERGAPVPGGPSFEECARCFKCVDACPSTARQKMGEWYTVDRLTEQVLRDRVYYETSGGGVTASGGEAMVWAAFVAEFFRRLKEEGIHTALDTSGAVGGEKLDAVLKYTDLALVDLKIMDPEKHDKTVGAKLEAILENIRRIDRSGTPIIIRAPMVPGYTDGEGNMAAIADFALTLSGLDSIELLPYHRMAEAKYRQLGKPYPLPEVEPPADRDMEKAQAVLIEKGLKAIIPGRD